MTIITDEYMQNMLSKVKPYCLALLKRVDNFKKEDVQQIIWEHGRRNFALRQEGKIAIVAPITSEGDIAGFYIFKTSEEEAKNILSEDPAVLAGLFTFQTYSCLSFPGDSL